MTERKALDEMWSDPTHWTASGLYRCGADPRLMVLKRVGVGYTINIAHGRSWFVVGALVGVSLAPLLAHIALGPRAPSWLLLMSLLTPLSVTVISLVWLSRRDDS